MENKKEMFQQLRIFLGNTSELNLDNKKLVVDTLTYLLDLSKDNLEEISGEVLAIILELQDNKDFEIKALVEEARLKVLRLIRKEKSILRGTDNTDIYKDKRDKDGYITDMSLIVPPYSTQRVEHRTGDVLHYTEEIYIDTMGRYFRKIYENKVEETEESVAKGIMENFDK